MPSESPKSELEILVEAFQRQGVEFMLIGGQAEWLHGSMRATFDYDFCYSRSRENCQRLADALKRFEPTLRGAPADLPFRVDGPTIEAGCNFTFNTTVGSVDLLGYVEPFGGMEALIKNAEMYELGGMRIDVISLDDLIRIKRHLNRPKDRDSLMHLLAIKQIREEEQD